ncbi:Uncharacterised protein [Chlamydia trachomatis]|nr:Uncharacterised protein [Chlamydia trachomatis]CRH48670.1 Uncharacterised protein [Chlamydia trachomatis]
MPDLQPSALKQSAALETSFEISKTLYDLEQDVKYPHCS